MYFCHFLTGYAHSSCFWLVFHFIFHSFFTCFYCQLLFSGSKNEAKTDSKTSQKRLKNATVSTPIGDLLHVKLIDHLVLRKLKLLLSCHIGQHISRGLVRSLARLSRTVCECFNGIGIYSLPVYHQSY